MRDSHVGRLVLPGDESRAGGHPEGQDSESVGADDGEGWRRRPGLDGRHVAVDHGPGEGEGGLQDETSEAMAGREVIPHQEAAHARSRITHFWRVVLLPSIIAQIT